MAHTVARIITLQALTFLHPGTGQSTGVVDLPIQREVYSGHPMYASSGFKGCLRDKAEQKELDQNIITALFGKDTEKKNNKGGGEESNEQQGSIAGALAITDGRILAFPVRSLQQVFVWVTCPMVLNRLLRDAGLVDKKLLTTDLQTPVNNSAGKYGMGRQCCQIFLTAGFRRASPSPFSKMIKISRNRAEHTD